MPIDTTPVSASTGQKSALEQIESALDNNQRPPLRLWLRAFFLKPFMIGVASGALGWIVEAAVGATFPNTIGIGSGLPGPAALVLGPLLGLLAAVLGTFLMRFVAGSMQRGRIKTTIGQRATNYSITAPAWWAKGLITAAVVVSLFMLVGILALLREWLQSDSASAITRFKREFGSFLGVTLFSGILGGIVLGFLAFIERFRPPAKAFMLKSDFRWALWCAISFLIMSCVFTVPLCGAVALLVNPLFERVGLGPTLAFGGIATAAFMGLLVGLLWAREIDWAGRHASRAELASGDAVEILGHPTNWDVPVETSLTRVVDGMPWFLWRESADNRLGLSRPRYCTLAMRDGALTFEFFDPNANRRATGALMAFCVVAGLVAAAMIVGWLTDTTPRRAYVFDERSPPFLVLLSTVLYSSVLGGLVSGVAYFLVTLKRWYWGRFEEDGGIMSRPLADLIGFEVKAAGELGAKIRGEEVKTGYGLTATFADGSMWILTANAWDHPSIVRRHGALTNAFRVPRDEFVAAFENQRRRNAAQEISTRAVDGGVSADGIPDTL